MRKKLIVAAVVAAFFAVPVAIKFGASKPKHEAELATVQKLEIHPSLLALASRVSRDCPV